MPKYQIKIQEPCGENWNTMTPVEKGRFCSSCKKNVIDFTNTSDIELARLINNNQKICGRFKASQLNKDLVLPQSNPLQKIGYFFGLASFLGVSNPILSQVNKPKIEKTDNLNKKLSDSLSISKDSITIKGIVADESGPLPGVTVLIKDTEIGVETNFDGEFQIDIDKIDKPLTIEFTFIGCKKESRIINKHNYSNLFEVKLSADNIMGEVVILPVKGSKKLKRKESCKTSTHKK